MVWPACKCAHCRRASLDACEVMFIPARPSGLLGGEYADDAARANFGELIASAKLRFMGER